MTNTSTAIRLTIIEDKAAGKDFLVVAMHGKDQDGKSVVVTGTFHLTDIFDALGQLIEYGNWVWIYEVGTTVRPRVQAGDKV